MSAYFPAGCCLGDIFSDHPQWSAAFSIGTERDILLNHTRAQLITNSQFGFFSNATINPRLAETSLEPKNTHGYILQYDKSIENVPGAWLKVTEVRLILAIQYVCEYPNCHHKYEPRACFPCPVTYSNQPALETPPTLETLAFPAHSFNTTELNNLYITWT